MTSVLTDGWFWLGIIAIVAGLLGLLRGERVAGIGRPPSPAGAAAASALLPGLGQVWLGLRRGWWMIGVIALLIATGLLIEPSSATALAWLTSLPVIIALGLLNVAVLAARAAASFDAWNAARRLRREERFALAGPLVAMTIGLILVPHVLAAAYGYLYLDVITNVFGGTTSHITDDGRLNVLLVGIDQGPGRSGARADSIVLASVDRSDGSTAIFSISRNLSCVPAPAEVRAASDCYPDMINSLWQAAELKSALAPGEAGLRATGYAVEQLLDVEIDHLAAVNLQGVVDLIDALGGVTVNVPERVFDGIYPHEDGSVQVIDIPAGPAHLDGHTTLAFMRSRRLSDDYDRMSRQQLVLEALVAETEGWALLLHFPDIARAVDRHVLTDIPLSEVPDLIDLLVDTDPERTIALCIGPPRWADVGEGRVVPRLDSIRNAVQIAISQTPEVAANLLDLEENGSTCSL